MLNKWQLTKSQHTGLIGVISGYSNGHYNFPFFCICRFLSVYCSNCKCSHRTQWQNEIIDIEEKSGWESPLSQRNKRLFNNRLFYTFIFDGTISIILSCYLFIEYSKRISHSFTLSFSSLLWFLNCKSYRSYDEVSIFVHLICIICLQFIWDLSLDASLFLTFGQFSWR